MGHDIDIIDIENGEIISSAYITGNFTKYSDEYPGIHAIHGHKNSTVIRILTNTLNKMANDGISPSVNKKYSAWGSTGRRDNVDKKYDLECYYLCLQGFLNIATNLNKTYSTDEFIYWYSDQVWEITKFKEETTNGYESDGIQRPKDESDYLSD